MKLNPSIRHQLPILVRARWKAVLPHRIESPLFLQDVQSQLIGLPGMDHDGHSVFNPDPELAAKEIDLFFLRVLSVVKVQSDLAQSHHLGMIQHGFNSIQV